MPKQNKKSNELKLCLVVEMVIQPNGVDEKLIRNQVLSIVDQAVDGGTIVGTTGAELVAHKAYISRFTRDPKETSENKRQKATG